MWLYVARFVEIWEDADYSVDPLDWPQTSVYIASKHLVRAKKYFSNMTKKRASLFTIQVTQLEVAIRQLTTAVVLFFADGDPCSIYSLARNAEEILSVILKKKGQKSMWNQMLDECIKPEYREEVRRDADNPRNDFKHARHPANQLIEFYPETNRTFLLVGVEALRVHYPDLLRKNPDLITFMMWYAINHPEVLHDEVREAIVSSQKYESYKGLSKPIFYKKYMEIVRHVATTK